MYSRTMDQPELDTNKNNEINKHQKLKGVSKAVVNDCINHSLYKKCLEDSSFKHSVIIHSIHSKNHKVFTIKQEKTGLSSFDDKRFILPDGITTRAHGHYRNVTL